MRRSTRGRTSSGGWVSNIFLVFGAVTCAAACFFVLPMIQALGAPEKDEKNSVQVNAVALPPPPPPVEEKDEPEEEPEETPDLEMDSPNLDLSQLELALNPGFGSGGWMSGDFGVKIDTSSSVGKSMNELFSLADLDQQPRAIYRPMPAMNAQVRKNSPGKVYIIFIVNERGRVESPRVQTPGNPVLEKAALAAVKKWKFEPGKRNGDAVRFRMRCPITFPEG